MSTSVGLYCLSTSRFRGYAAAVLALGLAVRLAYVAQLRGSILFEQPQGDALLHFELARQIAAGDWIGEQIFYYAPLYPYVVALVFCVAGASIWAVALSQVALSTLDVWVILALARRLFGDRVGLVAGCLAALYGPFVFYTGFLLKETLGLLLLDGFVLVTVWMAERGTWRLSFLPGMLLGLATLVRPNLLPLALVIVVWLGFELSRSSWTRWAAASFFFALGVATAVLPVSLRNYKVGKEWVWISAHGGHNFFVGNRFEASGLYEPLVLGGGQSPYEEQRDARRLAEQAKGRPLRYSEISAYWYARGWQEIRRHPWNFVRVTLRKLALFWNDFEIADFQDFYFLRRQCPALRGAPLTFGLVGPLAGVGLVASRRQWRSCLPLYLVVAGVLASVVPFFVFARYRLPVVPVLIVFAAVAIVSIARRVAARDWHGVPVELAVGLVCAIFVNWPIYRPSDFLATSYFNLGNLYRSAGKLDDAVVAWEQAVRLEPGYRKARRALGEAYFAAGRFAEAAESFSQAAEYASTWFSADADLTYMFGVSLSKTGRVEAATRILSQGRKLWPNDRRFSAALVELEQQSSSATPQ